jgi:hypothetical protein
MLNKKHNFFFILLIISSFAYSQHRSYTDKYEYRKKRHEVTFGIGASNCLTDLGGSFISDPNSEESQIDFLRSIYDTDLAKSNFSVNAAYIYHFKRKLNFRGNLSFAQIGADDAISKDLHRANRNLNFKSSIIEVSGIVEYYFAKPITGNKFNLKDVQGHKLAPNILAHWGFYIMGGVGGFYYNPKGQNNKVYNSGAHINGNFSPNIDQEWHSLRPLHTEGQGMEGNKTKFQKSGKTYSPVALCFPLGLGLEKAFNGDLGLKIEASYRFTNTDYLDDVSGVYHNRNEIESKYGITAAVMSGTSSGWERPYMAFVANEGDPAPTGGVMITDQSLIDVYGPRAYTITETSTDEGFIRGDPTANDSYMFFNISMYKKFSNHTKWYRDAHKNDKRKIKASF